MDAPQEQEKDKPQPDSSAAPAEARPSATPSVTGSLHVIGSLVRDLVFCVSVCSIIILFIYQPVKVEGGSMEPGLEDQERIFINKMVYRWESIERGDIIVFRYPRDPHKSFIKRVIGLPGDKVRIAFGHVYVNDKLVDEPYVPEEYLDARSYPETILPPETYFVLGDHRCASNDSREIGPIPRSHIYGKAVFGYWPMEKMGLVH